MPTAANMEVESGCYESKSSIEGKHSPGRSPKFSSSPSPSPQFGLPVIPEVDHNDVKIGGQIGGGGFAIVYAGKWKGQPVALKTLFDPRVDEALKEEFVNEVRVMSQVKHKHIVRLLGACLKPPNMCMVMQLCSITLFSYLHGESHFNITEKEKVRILHETAQGLDYLHSMQPKIIHRDVKSQNILLTQDLTVKICDFGLAGTEHRHAGTPAYMAPELLERTGYSHKVDVYAFGILLWEMVERCMPYQSWIAIDIKDFVCRGERFVVPNSGAPRPCRKLIEKCWAHEPQDRPEFKNIVRALGRIYSSMRSRTHVDQACDSFGDDSFDTLCKSMHK